MQILNCIFDDNRDLNCLFRDYISCLNDLHCELEILTIKNHSIIREYQKSNVQINILDYFSDWNPFIFKQINKVISQVSPNIILVHGAKAANMILNSGYKDAPIVTVLYSYFDLKSLKKADYIIVGSEFLKNNLLHHNYDVSKIFLVPNMLYISPRLAFKELKFNNKVPTIGAIGDLDKKSGIKAFIQSLGILRKEGIKFRARICGRGPELDDFRETSVRLLLDDILSFDDSNNPEEFYNNIDILCIPSLQSDTGVAILEGFKYSLPLVVSNIDAYYDIAIDHNNCLTFIAGEPDDLAEKLINMIEDKDLRKSLSYNGFKSLVTKFDNKTVGIKLYKTIEKILGSKIVT